jgi:hypothetical protein
MGLIEEKRTKGDKTLGMLPSKIEATATAIASVAKLI